VRQGRRQVKAAVRAWTYVLNRIRRPMTCQEIAREPPPRQSPGIRSDIAQPGAFCRGVREGSGLVSSTRAATTARRASHKPPSGGDTTILPLACRANSPATGAKQAARNQERYRTAGRVLSRSPRGEWTFVLDPSGDDRKARPGKARSLRDLTIRRQHRRGCARWDFSRNDRQQRLL